MTPWHNIAEIVLLAQKKGAEGAGGGGGFGNMWIPMLAIGVLWYFLLIRPQRSERNKMKEMLGNLQKHDRIVTIGGIFGTVANVQQGSESVTLSLDDGNNTRMRVLRSAISRVITDDDKDSAKDTSKP